MASVVKRGEFFTAVFYAPGADGKTVQKWRGTRQKDKRKALRVALELEAVAKSQGEVEGRKFLEVLEKAVQKASRGLLTADLAQHFIAEVYRLSSNESIAQSSVGSWMDGWLAQKKATVKPRSFRVFAKGVDRFKDFLEKDQNKPLGAITIRHLRDFRDSLKAEGLSGTTCNSHLQTLRAIFKAAVREGLIMRSPAEALESLPADDSIHREPFTMAEIARLLRAAPSREWEGVILLGAFAGLRLGDAANLKAGSVSTTERLLRFQPSKTSRHRRVLIVPFHPELTGFFESYRLPENPELPCFPSLVTKPDGVTAFLSQQFSKIIRKAGLNRNQGRRPKAGESGRSIYARSFHSLRHSFVSLMANRDVAAEMRMELAGHSTNKAHRLYTSTELATLRRAIESIPLLSDTEEKA